MSFFFPKFVDEAVPLTKQQRKTARDNAWLQWRSYKLNICIYIAVPITIICAYAYALYLLDKYLGGNISDTVNVLGTICFYISLWMGWRLMQHFRFAPHYRAAVCKLGYDICVGCGYWLRGLDKSIKACPECRFARTNLHKQTSTLKWSEEDRKRLRAIGYDPCRDCGAIFSSEVELCPECSMQREPLAESCEDLL